ncbi:MAG: FAD-dependent oxidoreductase [Nocardioidaceae bacterium]
MTAPTDSTPEAPQRVVIVGGGLAGAHAAETLREQGFDGRVTIVGAEPHLPYERPPLSKGLLLGSDEPDSVFVHDQQWYDDQRVTLRTGTRATAIHLDAREVALDDGTRLPYDRLLLATGAQPRHLPMADESGADIAYLRTLDDSRALLAGLSGSLLVIGAGWIGLEVASAARQAGAEVTVVESAPAPLSAVLGPELADVVASLHREHGVDLRTSTGVESIEHADGRTVVRLSDGAELHPDRILVAIGAVPDDALAAAAGLATDKGVLVNAGLRTSDPHVWAAGDVAQHDHPTHGRIRVEHWDTAIQHGKHAARGMLGDEAPYTQEPYFFTDQYDLGMEYVGNPGPDGYDEVVVRGDRESRVLTALWLRRGTVVAGMHLNDWDAIDPIRAWVGHEATAELRDTSVALGDVPLPDSEG